MGMNEVGRWLVQMEWCSAGRSHTVCLPLLSPLAP